MLYHGTFSHLREVLEERKTKLKMQQINTVRITKNTTVLSMSLMKGRIYKVAKLQRTEYGLQQKKKQMHNLKNKFHFTLRKDFHSFRSVREVHFFFFFFRSELGSSARSDNNGSFKDYPQK